MKIALIEKSQVTRVAEHQSLFPNTSFPEEGPDEDFLARNGALKVATVSIVDESYQKLVACKPFIRDGFVFTQKIEPLSAVERSHYIEQLALKCRIQRNQLLMESDWTQLADAPVNAEAWVEYRQKLRDLSLQASFPLSVIWPIPPTNQS